MIVLDTNVISEPMRPEPAGQVVGWLDAQEIGTLYLTTITPAEVRLGIKSLPVGRRRSILGRRFEDETVPLYSGRILPFDEPASICFAELQAEARSRGRPLGTMDALIAAICRASRLDLATSNSRTSQTRESH